MIRVSALRAAWAGYVAAGVAVVVAYYVLPLSEALQAVLFLAAPLGAAVVTARTSRRAAPSARGVWCSLSVALSLATASDLIYVGAPLVTGHWIKFPSVVDVIWLTSYPFYVLAIWALVRRQRESDRLGNLLDVAIIAANGAIPMWCYVIDPILNVRGGPAAGEVIAALYPTMDLVVFATLLRFVVAGRTTPAMRLLVAALSCLLVADVNYVFQLTRGTFADGGPSDALWIFSGVLVAAAALHPSARAFVFAEPEERPRLTAGRMTFLGIALLVGPAVLSSHPHQARLLAAMSALSFVLVMTRMWVRNHNLTVAHATVEQTTDLMRYQALHDALTGLPNRMLLLDRIDRMQARARRSGDPCAVLQLDLDGFKAVNDALGHDTGDRLLVGVAHRLRTSLPGIHTIARLGGDEFVLLVEDAALAAAPELVAERVLEIVRQPFELDEGTPSTVVSASVGIAVGPRPSPGELLREADVAVYEAKASGGDACQRFLPEMEVAVQRRYELEVDLRSALARGEFFLLYQPIFALADGTVAGFEALLRWMHPSKGLIGPNEFIPLLEDSGHIVEVGRWVLREACRQTAAWRAGGRPVGVSVNVSGRQLDRDSVVEHVAEALRDSGLAPHALTVEITETALMNNVTETSRRLRELTALGVHIAVDDFGTGYSSLAYLQQFPVDCLKIDRTFTSAIGRSPESDAMIHTLAQLGQGLGLETLAEGVETEQQLAVLQAEQVDYVQGFLLARPLAADAAARLLLGRVDLSA